MRKIAIPFLCMLLASTPVRAQIVAGNVCTTNDTAFYGGTYFTCPSGQWVQQMITTTIQVGTTNAACTAASNGLLRIQGNLLQVCVGTAWKTVVFL